MPLPAGLHAAAAHAAGAAAASMPSPPPGMSPAATAAAAEEPLLEEVQTVAVASHEFFAEALTDVAWVFAVLVAFCLLAWLWITVWAFLLRLCRMPDHWVRLTAYAWGALLLAMGVMAALGAVGVNVAQAAVTLGLFSIACTYGLGSVFADLAAGVRLQMNGLFASHAQVRLPALNNLTGTIVSMNLLHVVVRPSGSGGGDSASSSAGGPHHVLVPNKDMTDGTVEVWWQREQHFEEQPSRAFLTAGGTGGPTAARPMTASEQRAAALAKRHDDGPGRFAGGADAPFRAAPALEAAGAAVSLPQRAKQLLDAKRQRLRTGVEGPPVPAGGDYSFT